MKVTLWVLLSLLLSETGGSPLIWTIAFSSGSLCWMSRTRLRRSSFSTTTTSALASRASLAISSALKMLDWPTAIPLKINVWKWRAFHYKMLNNYNSVGYLFIRTEIYPFKNLETIVYTLWHFLTTLS